VGLIQWACGSQANQQFRPRQHADGSFSLVARHSGKCVEIADASTADLARVIQYSCSGAADQRFRWR